MCVYSNFLCMLKVAYRIYCFVLLSTDTILKSFTVNVEKMLRQLDHILLVNVQ